EEFPVIPVPELLRRRQRSAVRRFGTARDEICAGAALFVMVCRVVHGCPSVGVVTVNRDRRLFAPSANSTVPSSAHGGGTRTAFRPFPSSPSEPTLTNRSANAGDTISTPLSRLRYQKMAGDFDRKENSASALEQRSFTTSHGRSALP